MCMYVNVFACICMYNACMSVFYASIDMIWRACCMCMYLHVSVCIRWLPLFTCGCMCAVGIHWAWRVAEQTTRDLLFWNSVLFFKGRQPGSLWAKPWPTCWCSTGGCLSRARHARPIALASHHEDASAYSPSSCPPPDPCILLMNSSSLASRYWRIHTHTFKTDTYIHWPTFENQFVMTWARSLRKRLKSDWHIWKKCILTNTCTHIQYMHIHTYSN